jgi:hypothetical protein
MSIDTLYALAACTDAAIAKRAVVALQITESHNRGDISTDEYQELCRDMCRMDALDHECTSVEFKTALVTAVFTVAQLV